MDFHANTVDAKNPSSCARGSRPSLLPELWCREQIIQLFSQAFVLSSEACSPARSIDFHLLTEIIKKFSAVMMSDDLCT